MNLLLFYLEQIFSRGSFPLPQDICQNAEAIAPMCNASIGFTLIYTLTVMAFTIILFRKNIVNNYALIPTSLLLIFSCFVLTDHSMKQIAVPAKFGIEWFIIQYNLWVLFIFNLFLACILLPARSRFFVKLAAFITVIFIPLFAHTGRGNFEQITPIAGGLFAKLSLDMLWLSFSARFFVFLAVVSILAGFLSTLTHWIVRGKFKFTALLGNIKRLCWFFIIIVLPVISVFLGDIYNKKDSERAKTYIDSIKAKVNKYYLENGQYPKFIEDFIPEGRSPKLLERHEFFTMGIRGTYFFSREDKYCFIFQNPARDFGYYSITNDRGWRYSLNTKSFDDSFINLCDESEKNFQDLISSHMGIDSEDKLINELSLEAGAPPMPMPLSNKASKELERKIMEESKRDPSVLKYFKAPKENK